ncbi:hypothetical protein GF420_08340 [candidate division GN15 bacterium]|nr:hypothetical protein [candidate division GN15 bacterium]
MMPASFCPQRRVRISDRQAAPSMYIDSMDFAQCIQAAVAPIIADGAIGTELIRRLEPTATAWRGCSPCCELLNKTAAQLVMNVHRDYLNAGASVLTTNTFCGSEPMLRRYGLEQSFVELNRRGVELARDTRLEHSADDRAWIAGSVGPIMGIPAAVDFESAYARQVEVLLQSGVDLLVFETFPSPDSLRPALSGLFHAAGKTSKVPIVLLFSPTADEDFLDASAWRRLKELLSDRENTVVGANCGTGPLPLEEALREISGQFDGPLALSPSAGLPTTEAGRTVYPKSPSTFFTEIDRLCQSYRILLAGGCCGTTPAHIAALTALRRSDTVV